LTNYDEVENWSLSSFLLAVSLIISLWFTDYEESYYDYDYKDDYDYLETDLLGIGSEGLYV
jgi:hypothetical protein